MDRDANRRIPVKLPRDFYLRDDVVEISRELLGMVLCTKLNRHTTKAIITETEAYAGVGDKASHAYRGRRTKRTEPIFGEGGAAYVYLCYGIHHLFNVVTNEAETPHAVLIRAATPLEGAALMQNRRNKREIDKTLLAGPGSVAQALGITTELTGVSLLGNKIWIEEQVPAVGPIKIEIGPRIGIDYAQEDVSRPYRFVLQP